MNSAVTAGGGVGVLALFRGRAQNEEPRVRHTCDMGVGCEEYGICYAEAHGEPDRCGRPAERRKPTSEERQGHADFLSTANTITTAMDHFLAGVDFAKSEAFRPAIAELIAADREYDEARAMVDDIAGCPFPSDFERLESATARRASALAALEQQS